MRSFLAGLIAVGLLVTPALSGTIDVEMRVNGVAGPATLNVGQTATVEGWFKSTGAGVYAIGGNVTAAGTGGLSIEGTPLAANSFYVADFCGFMDLRNEPGTTIPPAVPVAGVNGAVSIIGSAQSITNQATPFVDTAWGNGSYVKLFSYTVKGTAAGTVTLQWQDAGEPGYGGWYTTDTSMVDGIANSAGVTITVNAAQTQANLIDKSVDFNVNGKKTLWRSKKNVLSLTFDKDITAPAVGQLTIQKLIAGSTYGSDLSSNFTFTVVNDPAQGNAPRILRIFDNSTNGVLENLGWYSFRNTGGWATAANFEHQVPVMVGDATGDARVLSNDVTSINSRVSSAVVAIDSRFDIDGTGQPTAGRVLSSDVTLANPKVGTIAVPKPSGW